MLTKQLYLLIHAWELILRLHVFSKTWQTRRIDCFAPATGLSHKDAGILLSVSPKDTTPKYDAFFLHIIVFARNAKQGSCDYRF